MSGALASLVCLLFVLWLVARDGKRRPRPSLALWIPSLWVIIIGSKPVSSWLGLAGDSMENTAEYIEGSPFDRMVFLGLIAAGLVVLAQRRLNWSLVRSRNKWLFIYFLYLGISTLWSDFPFVSFKRWIKDAGNIIMVLIILSEVDPVAAARSVLVRCSYLIIPFSVVYIKYYPSLGRYYDQWTGQPYYCGVTGNKNALGMSLFVSSLALFWKFTDLWAKRKTRQADKTGLLVHVFLGLMLLWLLNKAHSSTAVVCTVVGSAIIVAMKLPAVRSKVGRIGLWSGAALLLLFIANSTFDLGAAFVELVGRDLTFTGRTDIWKLVLSEDINPVLGVGFYSFWLGDRMERLSEEFYYHLNQAHNGYLETYLNTGYIGVVLLIIVLFTSVSRIKNTVMAGSQYGALRLAFLATIMFYNMTEATFDRLNLVWFVLVLVVMDYTTLREAGKKNPAPPPGAEKPAAVPRNSRIQLGQLRE